MTIDEQTNITFYPHNNNNDNFDEASTQHNKVKKGKGKFKHSSQVITKIGKKYIKTGSSSSVSFKSSLHTPRRGCQTPGENRRKRKFSLSPRSHKNAIQVINGKNKAGEKNQNPVNRKRSYNLEKEPLVHSAEARLSIKDRANLCVDREMLKSWPCLSKAKAEKFNVAVISSIEDSIRLNKERHLDQSALNGYLKGIIDPKVDEICSELEEVEDLFMNLSFEDLQYTYHAIAVKTHSIISDKGLLHQLVQKHLLQLKVFLGRTLEIQNIQKRTLWLETFYSELETCLGFYTSMNEKNRKGKLNCLVDYIIDGIDDAATRRLVLMAVHPDENEAIAMLKSIKYLASTSSLCDIAFYVKIRFSDYQRLYYIKHHPIEFGDETALIKKSIEEANVNKVLKSFADISLRKKPVIFVNSSKVTFPEVPSNEFSEQKKLLEYFMRQLFKKGLAKESNIYNPTDKSHGNNISSHDELIGKYVNNFVKKLPVIGDDLIFLASEEGWKVCEKKVRGLYPNLFSSPFNTKPHIDRTCHINIQSKHSYSLNIERSYMTYSNGNIQNESSQDRSLCTFKVTWELAYESKNGNGEWSSDISIVNLCRINPRSDEWNTILNVFENPYPVEGVKQNLPKSFRLNFVLNKHL